MRINIVGGTNTLYYILKDHLGSASVVTDASGLTVGEQRYYPYGETRLTTGTIYTDRLFTGQREMTGLGIYDYGARFFSPKTGRFLSPDSIVPGAGNPQAFNRYLYVLGNPLKYTYPTGHGQCQTKEDCADMGTTPMGTGGSGGGSTGGGGGGGGSGHHDNDIDPNPMGLPAPTGGGNGGINNEDFLGDVAYFADNVGAITSDIEFIVVDTIGVIVIVGGCSTGAGCVPALGYALAIDVGVSWFSPLGAIENWSGGIAFGATALEDAFINGATYIHSDGNGGYDVGIGRDTVVSTANAIAGLVPEANYDAWISNQQLEYDNQRRSGELPAISLFEFHIPQPPNLWGSGWPNSP